MTLTGIPELYTPEELEEHFGRTPTGRKKLAAYEIRRMVRQGRIMATRGPRDAILLTPDQVQAMLDALAYAPPAARGNPPEGVAVLGFKTSRRSGPRA